jgi:hypothetical protein
LVSYNEGKIRQIVFKNRALMMFGPERDGVRGEWRRLFKEQILLCTSHQTLLG